MEPVRNLEPLDEAPGAPERPPAPVFGMPRPGYTPPMSSATPYATDSAYAGRPFGIQHKLAGFLSWFAVAWCVWGVLRFPGRLSLALSGVVAYLLVRMAVTVAFSLRGDRLSREWQARDWADASDVADLVKPRHPDPAPPFSPADVHHVVLLPNYKESLAVLEATLRGLARQRVARRQVTLVLAMESKEPGAAEKGAATGRAVRRTRSRTSSSRSIPATCPARSPARAATRRGPHARRSASWWTNCGVPIERVTVTSCDADSILHPDYLEALGRMYVADALRLSTFWQAPMLYYNNLWRVPVPIRFMAYFTHALLMAELANPFAQPLPISTYSLSLKMLDAAGYWDPAVISEDWHIYLQCWFSRRGDVRLAPVFLPTSADMPDGATRVEGAREHVPPGRAAQLGRRGRRLHAAGVARQRRPADEYGAAVLARRARPPHAQRAVVRVHRRLAAVRDDAARA